MHWIIFLSWKVNVLPLGFLLGVLILRAVLKKQQVSPIWSVLQGTIIIKLITYIPYVGWLVNFFVLLLAMGALLYLAGQHWFRRPPRPEANPQV